MLTCKHKAEVSMGPKKNKSISIHKVIKETEAKHWEQLY